jgi:hypothetical protein
MEHNEYNPSNDAGGRFATVDKIRQTVYSVPEHRLFVMVLPSNRALISQGLAARRCQREARSEGQ